MVRMKFLFVVLMMVTPLASNAQHNRNKNKDSKARGTMFGYWGYNRSGYTKSNISFVGPDYDFTLNGSTAHDHFEEFTLNNYFNINNLTIPQFNARIGYYIILEIIGRFHLVTII